MDINNTAIWKKTDCLTGECKGSRTKHFWSMPFSVPIGLMTECLHCNIKKVIIADKS